MRPFSERGTTVSFPEGNRADRLRSRPMKLAVVGAPVAHSRSPAIHNAALSEAGIEGVYVARRVDAAGLGDVIADLRAGRLDGVNVTMPHKSRAAELVDELAADARRAGSVNTIVRGPEGELVGHSTDVSALRRLWPGPTRMPTLVLGTGGAAGAACVAAGEGSLYLSGRRRGAAVDMLNRLGIRGVEVPWQCAVVGAVVVNATPLGMRGEELPPRVVDLASALVDMTYAESESPALVASRRAGRPVVSGLELLVAQAADSFRLWTGVRPSVDVMTAAASNHSREPTGTPNQ